MNNWEEKLRQWAAREKETALPSIVRERMDRTLASLPEKHHRFSVRRAVWSVAAAVALLIGGTIAAGFVSPTLAQALKRIPLIGSVFETVGDYGLKTADQKGLTSPVNKEIRIGADTIKVTEVLYDGNRLSIGFIYRFKNQIDMTQLPEMDIQVNGKSKGAALTGGPVDRRTFHGILLVTPETGLKSFTINLVLTDKKDRHKTWQLAFPVQLTSHPKVYTVNATKSARDLTVHVSKITFTETSTAVVVDMIYHHPLKESWKDINSNPFFPPEYIMMDDHGRVIQSVGLGHGRYKPDNGFQSEETFLPFKQIPRYVILIPVGRNEHVKLPIPHIEVKMDHVPTPQKPVLLSQGKAGQLRINRVEFLPDKTVVHYQSLSKDPFRYYYDLELKDHTRKYQPLRFPQVENPDTYSFVAEFPAWKKGEPLTFVTRDLPAPIIRDDLAVKVMIPQK